MDGGWHYFQSDDPGPLTSKGELVNIAPGIYRAQNVDGGSSENYLPWSRTTLRTMSLLCEENYGEVRFANRMLNENEEVPENETTLHNNASREAINSVMNPNCVESQKDFRVALILVTRDGYANDALMSGLHALALYHEGEHIGVPTTDMPGYTAQIISGSLRYASRNTATFRLDIPPFD